MGGVVRMRSVRTTGAWAEGECMQLVNDIKPVTYLKSRTADVLRHINETHRPMIITQNGEAKAVIQDPKS